MINIIVGVETPTYLLTNASNIDYEAYNKLSDIEHSLYRYNNFLKNGMRNYAEKEARNLVNLSEENSTVLEGGISNIKYIWHTEPNACEKCQELDGTEYNSKEDIQVYINIKLITAY